MTNTKNPYYFLNTFYFRTPLFPVNFYKKIFEKKEVPYEELNAIWKNEQINEAVFIASPALHKQLAKLFLGEIKQTKKKEQLKYAFLKYLIRLSTRCTPFGLFASVSYGALEKETNIELIDTNSYRKENRLDTHVLSSILETLSNIPTIKSQLLFYTNNSLYKIANQYRYIEYQLLNNKRSYSVEAVEDTIYLEKILQKAKEGITIQNLVEVIVKIDTTITKEEATIFINSLIENQLLISSLSINLTGEDTLEYTIASLKEMEIPSDVLNFIEELQYKLGLLDGNKESFKNIHQSIQVMLKRIDIPFNPKYLIQTDMFGVTSANKLKATHLYTIKKTIPFLNKLSVYNENANLAQFKKAFIERYESKEIPLAHVLDVETGIGYIQHNAISDTTSFLENINPKSNKKDKSLLWTEVNEILLFKLLKIKGGFVLELTDKDFENIGFDWKYTPDTITAFTEIFKDGEEERIILHGFTNNAGKLLGRFSYGDKRLESHLNEITEIEKQLNPNKILAEIVHLPESRTGNILKRTHVRDYEIPYLGKSTLPINNQIPINDLLVSVKNNKVILKSKKLNKEVVPKLTNAHNYAPKALPIYHFLCDLQSQDEKKYIGFSWPSIVEGYSFLPRVVYKNVIISKATWCFTNKVIEKLIYNITEDTKLLEAVLEFREKFKIPRYVQYSKKDNSLLIDFQNIESIKLLLNSVKNKKVWRLDEFLFTNDSVVQHNKESFANEFIFTFHKKESFNTI
ncbi:lantibiotic biosynthesis protein [Tenacibaculum sp. 190524A02b]|uniref:Lantibiotic biosynthesis protein n=1 Tax=Tenacibaculum vairaonense TaxID=3137860 RepID=A0ABM9PPT2_9FLAO